MDEKEKNRLNKVILVFSILLAISIFAIVGVEIYKGSIDSVDNKTSVEDNIITDSSNNSSSGEKDGENNSSDSSNQKNSTNSSSASSSSSSSDSENSASSSQVINDKKI